MYIFSENLYRLCVFLCMYVAKAYIGGVSFYVHVAKTCIGGASPYVCTWRKPVAVVRPLMYVCGENLQRWCVILCMWQKPVSVVRPLMYVCITKIS